MKATCMNQLELAVRWGISHRTPERWRWTGEGPKFLKVGGRVVYRLSDVEEYEQSIVRSSTSDRGQAQQRARDYSSRTAVGRGAAAILALSLACIPYQFRLNPHRFSDSLTEKPETGLA